MLPNNRTMVVERSRASISRRFRYLKVEGSIPGIAFPFLGKQCSRKRTNSQINFLDFRRDQTAWKSKPMEWTDGRSLRWQLPILWRKSFPWSPLWKIALYKMDRWMSPTVEWIPYFNEEEVYAVSSGKINSQMARHVLCLPLNQCEDWLVQPYRREGTSNKI